MSILSGITVARPLLLLGCGRMGTALLHGWLEAGVSDRAIQIIDPDVAAARKRVQAVGENCFAEKISDLPRDIMPGFVVLAVKPQMMDQAMKDLMAADLTAITSTEVVFLSIAAGKTIGYFSRHLGADAAIIRAMPNSPAAIGKGISVACANHNVSGGQKEVCHHLLAAVGAVEWIQDESLLDAVTALSGSGPAYVFYLAEALAQAGEQAGLPLVLAEKLARHTISGAGALLEQAGLEKSGENAAVLRRNVTSPNGTTEAALKVLMKQDGLGKLMRDTVRAALRRSQELAD